MKATILQGDVLARIAEIPDETVQCVVTSPPYWGLRDYGVAGQLGLEPTPEEFVEKMVVVFREVRRVLRQDGTLWLNMGDSYAQAGGPGWQGKNGLRADRRFTPVRDTVPQREIGRRPPPGLKAKDLVGMPWRLAFALQADGWWLRSDIVWSKPNPMPESVTDRPTKAHEFVFLLTRAPRYFFDSVGAREPYRYGRDHHRTMDIPPDCHVPAGAPHTGLRRSGNKVARLSGRGREDHRGSAIPWQEEAGGGRNMRSVWEITTQAFPEAHFATFPEELAKRCIFAGKSEKGACQDCGSPWIRKVEDTPEYAEFKASEKARKGGGMRSANLETLGLTAGTSNKSVSAERVTTGWKPSCECEVGARTPRPCVVLDPFMGSGTTGLVSLAWGRDFVGIELNPEYAAMARRRIGDVAPLLAEVTA